MGIAFYGEMECHKCHRNIAPTMGDELLLTKQFGCKYCNKAGWPKYRPDYIKGDWVVLKEYWKPLKSWFGLGPVKDYLVEEQIRFANDPAAPVLCFESLNMARAYIRKLTGEEDPEKPKREAREAFAAYLKGIIE